LKLRQENDLLDILLNLKNDTYIINSNGKNDNSNIKQETSE
jgi:hypothetical protein